MVLLISEEDRQERTHSICSFETNGRSVAVDDVQRPRLQISRRYLFKTESYQLRAALTDRLSAELWRCSHESFLHLGRVGFEST